MKKETHGLKQNFYRNIDIDLVRVVASGYVKIGRGEGIEMDKSERRRGESEERRIRFWDYKAQPDLKA